MAADDEQFSLSWNNFGANLSSGLHDSLCRSEFVDVTLAAEGQLVRAHRLVLSACSPYFREMFTQMPSHQHGFVFLKDVSHTALKDLIQFMYSGEVNMKQEDLPTFISTAEALQIKGLTDAPEPPSNATSAAQIPSIPIGTIGQQSSQPLTPTNTITTSSVTPTPPTAQPIYHRPRTSTTGSTASSTMTTVHHHQQQQSAPVSQPQLRLTSQVHTAKATPATNVQKISTISHDESIDDKPIVQKIVQKRAIARSITPQTTPAQKRTKMDTIETEPVPQIVAEIIDEPTVKQSSSTASLFVDIQPDDEDDGTASGHHEQQLQSQMRTKSEPIYADDDVDSNGEMDTGGGASGTGQEATYVEDDSYGDMKYDETYFTENDDGPKAGTSTYTEYADGDQSAGEQQDAIQGKYDVVAEDDIRKFISEILRNAPAKNSRIVQNFGQEKKTD